MAHVATTSKKRLRGDKIPVGRGNEGNHSAQEQILHWNERRHGRHLWRMDDDGHRGSDPDCRRACRTHGRVARLNLVDGEREECHDRLRTRNDCKRSLREDLQTLEWCANARALSRIRAWAFLG